MVVQKPCLQVGKHKMQSHPWIRQSLRSIERGFHPTRDAPLNDLWDLSDAKGTQQFGEGASVWAGLAQQEQVQQEQQQPATHNGTAEERVSAIRRRLRGGRSRLLTWPTKR